MERDDRGYVHGPAALTETRSASPDEAGRPARVDALNKAELLDAPRDTMFDQITRLASSVLDAPVSLMTVIDDERQFFVSEMGLPEPLANTRQRPIETAYCRHVIESGEPVVIRDAETNPLVSEIGAWRDGFVSYLGVPVRDASGVVLASLCVADSRPRGWTEKDLQQLSGIASMLNHAVTNRTLARERLRQQEHVRLLLREVNHRSKNLLTVVQSVARQTAASAPDDFLQRFEQRLLALAAAQDLLVLSDWKDVPLEDLVRCQLSHVGDHLAARIRIRGPAVRLKISAAQTLGMAFHELGTNALKHGALSNADGVVEISWRVEPAAGAQPERIIFLWAERDGPPVAQPRQRGFGSILVNGAVRAAFNGEVTHEFEPEGVTWRLECAASKVLQGAPTASDQAAPTDREAASVRPRVLVVEDDVLIGLELEEILTARGFHVLGPATTVAKAEALLDAGGCDVALLDVNLGDETSEPIAARLSKEGAPFVVLTGYAAHQLPEVYGTAPILSKPIRAELILRRLDEALGRR